MKAPISQAKASASKPENNGRAEDAPYAGAREVAGLTAEWTDHELYEQRGREDGRAVQDSEVCRGPDPQGTHGRMNRRDRFK
jgi:hypothetical protein